MHFGYWQPFMSPFRRELMLEQMNRKVTGPLEASRNIWIWVVASAPPRVHSQPVPALRKVTGISIVPWQVKRARQMTASHERVAFFEDDYTQTDFADAEFDAAYAIERFCHGPGRDKAACLAEARRVLRPGGQLVIADGFLKSSAPLPPFLARCHRRICECWAMDSLPVLPAVRACLKENGFRVTAIENISWHVAISVAHVPFVTARFLWRELIGKQGTLSRERWNNLLAPLLTGIVGLARPYFGYYILRAERQ